MYVLYIYVCICIYARVSRAKKANVYTDEHVCAFAEKTIGDSEESADRLGAPRSLILSRARFLSASLSFLSSSRLLIGDDSSSSDARIHVTAHSSYYTTRSAGCVRFSRQWNVRTRRLLYTVFFDSVSYQCKLHLLSRIGALCNGDHSTFFVNGKRWWQSGGERLARIVFSTDGITNFRPDDDHRFIARRSSAMCVPFCLLYHRVKMDCDILLFRWKMFTRETWDKKR